MGSCSQFGGWWVECFLIWVLQEAFIKFLVANVLKFSKPMYRQRVKGPLALRKLSWDGHDYLLFRDIAAGLAASVDAFGLARQMRREEG